MKGLGRSFLYWGYFIEKIFFIMIAAVCIMPLIIGWLHGENIAEFIITVLPSYILMCSGILILINSMNNTSIYLPLSVSLGSSRGASYIAMQLMQHLTVIQGVALALLVFYLGNQDDFAGFLFQYGKIFIACIGFLIGFGNIIIITGLKKGRNAAMAVYFISFVLILVIAVWGLGIFNLSFHALFESPVLPCAGVLFDLLTIIISYRILQKCELQFA